MNSAAHMHIAATGFARSACSIGVVHLGFGAFHRAHQAVYIDDFMQQTNDLRWGIAAVNLRGSEGAQFEAAAKDVDDHDGYFLKSISSDGQIELRRVRSHVAFLDWANETSKSEALLAQPTVHLVTITVTESGYYTDPNGNLDTTHSVIAGEIKGEAPSSVYGYLRAALQRRKDANGAPLTIACCDNIRQNGKMLQRNLLAYLNACDDTALAAWMSANATFPCSMVDRITPRSPDALGKELTQLIGRDVTSPVMAEDFIQWVLQDNFAGYMPDLAKAGVTVTPDVDPYEETKIRVLNGGHTAMCYFAALENIETFDEIMRTPHLVTHFEAFETEEVLPAITLDLPFSKEDYLRKIAARFSNVAIGDTVARICADGMVKFPIFIRPTLAGCLAQGIMPLHSIRSIASWYVFAQHVAAGNIPFEYVEPSWDDLKSLLGTDDFITSPLLWGELPTAYPEFADTLRKEISELELKWPV
jgi:mannitol-1-phosphate/altronate dehydrogenase